MLVSALLFTPPGRGEFLKRTKQLPDAGMPTSASNCSERSVKAMQNIYPDRKYISPTRQVRVQGERWIAEGDHWSVEWVTDEYQKRREAFLSRLAAGIATTQEILSWAEDISTTEMVCAMEQGETT